MYDTGFGCAILRKVMSAHLISYLSECNIKKTQKHDFVSTTKFLSLNHSDIYNTCKVTKASDLRYCKLGVASEYNYEKKGWMDENNNILTRLNWAVGYPQLNGKMFAYVL